jgi:hypothetical protein
MHFMVSPLGRSLMLDDWDSYYQDSVLKLLFDVQTSPFNPADQPLILRSLENTTGLDSSAVAALCTVLAEHALVELFPPRGSLQAVRLTQAGRDLVWRLLATHGTGA